MATTIKYADGGWRILVEQLGIVLTPNLRRVDLDRLALRIEDAGFSSIHTPEVVNDSMIDSYAIALATSRIQISTWVSNIFLRAPALAATSAARIQEASHGRFTLGLGVSHRPLLECLGIVQGDDPQSSLRRYVDDIHRTWSGEINIFGARFPEPEPRVPIFLGSMLIETARRAGEIADGLFLLLCTPERYRRASAAATERAEAVSAKKTFAVTLGIQCFVDDDLEVAYCAARESVAVYLPMPNYNRMFAASGFEAEARAAVEAVKRDDHAALRAAVTDRLLDAVGLIGPAGRCRERLHAFREAGVTHPLLVPGPAVVDTATWVDRVIDAFAPVLD